MVAIEGRVFVGTDERPDVIHVEVDAVEAMLRANGSR